MLIYKSQNIFVIWALQWPFIWLFTTILWCQFIWKYIQKVIFNEDSILIWSMVALLGVKRGERGQNLEKIVDIIYRWPITKLLWPMKYTLKISKKIRLIQGFDFNCYWKIQQDRHKYFKWRLFFQSCLWNTYVLTSKMWQIYFLFQSFK